jgi:type II secretory pathway pseudopilin PulG
MSAARRQAGFSMAALVIFLTAASILLTISVPSYIMEAKREQEKEMIFRGEEYARAIQKYQRTLNLLPTSVDDLLSSNGTRFLRKAYADPVSGEPWRPIVLNPDGTLTGSNIYPTMANVPTTTSVRNTAQPATAPKASGGTNGTLATNNPLSSGVGGGLGAAGGAGLGTGGTGVGAGGTGLGVGGTGVGGATGANNGQRPPGNTGAAPAPGAQAAQPQQQATPLQGLVGVGSASKGTGVMVYNKQEQYSNWEFIAQLQQRNAPGAGGGGTGGGGGGGGGTGRTGAGGGGAGTFGAGGGGGTGTGAGTGGTAGTAGKTR